jgi:protein TonB
MKAQNTALPTPVTPSVSDSLVSEEMPEFPGGWMGMKKYLAENFIYPQIAKDSAYEGKCYLKFIIDTAGYIKDLAVLKGVPHCPACDHEAIRLVKAMPRWKPGKSDGKLVEVRFNIPIDFKMR